MEDNTAQQVNPTESPTQTVQQPKNNQRGNLPIILGVLILLLAVGGGAYYLGTQKNSSTKQSTNINTNSQMQRSPTQLLSEPSQTTVTAKNGVVVFEHPKAEYTLEYPASWKGGAEPIPAEIKQDYEDFIARSSDYQLSSGYPVLEKGSEFFVRVENSTEKSIDEIFNKNLLTTQIATNKTRTTVDGQEAIQYDYNHEGNIATMTEFLKNGKYYTVKYRYVDNASKQTEWNTYLNLLKSFKTK